MVGRQVLALVTLVRIQTSEPSKLKYPCGYFNLDSFRGFVEGQTPELRTRRRRVRQCLRATHSNPNLGALRLASLAQGRHFINCSEHISEFFVIIKISETKGAERL